MNVSLWRDPNWKPPAPSGMEPRRSVFVAEAPPPSHQQQPLTAASASPDAVAWAVQTYRIRPSEVPTWRAAVARDASAEATLRSLQPVPSLQGAGAFAGAQSSTSMMTPEALAAALWPEEQPQQPESGPVDALAAALWPEHYRQGNRG